MPKQKRLYADAISEIRSLDTHELLGWLYRWNNGDVTEAWVERWHPLLHQPLSEEASENRATAVSSAA